MNSSASVVLEGVRPIWWRRWHLALMPDYNRKAAAYWWTVVLMGLAILVHAVLTVWMLSPTNLMQVIVGVAIAATAAFFPVRIPGSKISFVAGETFIFLLLLLQGPAAAALAAAAEGLVGSCRTSRRWTSRIASPAMACVAMFGVGSLFQMALIRLHELALGSAGMLLSTAMLSSLLYFGLNTVLVTATGYLKRNEWPVLREMFDNFGWYSIVFAGSASIACLIFLAAAQEGVSVLFSAVPILVLLLVSLHFFGRQREITELITLERQSASDHEGRLAASHLDALERSEQRFQRAFAHAALGMALVSTDGVVIKVNLALAELLGLEDEAAIEQNPFSGLVADSDGTTPLDAHLNQLKSGAVSSFTIVSRLNHRLDMDVWASIHGSVFSEDDSTSPIMILQLLDITSRLRAESDLHYIAFHDSLTGLPNRRRFQEKLSEALAQLKGAHPQHFSLMFIDVDRFKLINDSLGHAVGDELLMAVAQGIKNQLRPTDIVARLGGDEFAILTGNLDSEQYAVSLAGRLVESLRLPFRIAGIEINSSVSIGVTFSAFGYETTEAMLRDADLAMYEAKAGGKSRFAVFNALLLTDVSYRLRLESDLRIALRDGQLSVAYQPIFELSSRGLVGFEALARWTHPALGAVGPEIFIPVAEEAGLISEITDFMLRSACMQIKAWQLSSEQFSGLYINVNISGRDIVHASLAGRVRTVLQEAGVAPNRLNLELTENILMKHLEAALPTLHELRQMGVGLTVDDFGTGHSSLRHLSALPVTGMKIDRGFLLNLEHGVEEAAVVKTIVALGQSLDKAVCAEGIETQQQMDQLRRMGCTLGQGYLLSHPLRADLVDQMLERLVVQSNVVSLFGGVHPTRMLQVATH